MTLLPAPARVTGPEQGALRPAWLMRGTKGPRIWARPAPRTSFPSRPAWQGLSPFPPKMPDIPELSWPIKWHRELFLWGRGFSKRTSDAAAVLLARSAREEMLTRPESCAALLTSKLQRRAWRVAHGAGLLPSSRERKKRVCRSTSSSRPHPRYSSGDRVKVAAVACVRSLPEPERTSADQGPPNE